MPINVTMPRLSDTMEAGTVVKWNVKEGDKVTSGDVIADIETDKATMELQAFDDGVVAKLLAAEGKTVKIGETIAVLAGPGEDVSSIGAGGVAHDQKQSLPKAEQEIEKASSAPTKAQEPENGKPTARAGTPAQHRDSDRVFASPLAKKLAQESGVDLRDLDGSGPSGRITRKDVEAAMAGAPAPRAPVEPKPSRAEGSAIPSVARALEGKLVPLSGVRRTIATRLVQSKTTIPHYQVTVEADMDALMSLREQLNAQLQPQGVKLSVNDFLVRACALAMHEHPYVNSRWIEAKGQEPAIELLADVNVAIAIALPEEKGGGLLIATLRSADKMGLRQISAESKRLSEKARTKGLTTEEMADSTFTISNLGMFGVDHFTAIINPPNAAILAVGAAIEKPVVRDGKIIPGWRMAMTMSSDHRIIDGAMAARYLNTVKGLLEAPATLLV